MTSIRETITSATRIPYGYDSYVNPVVEALTEREHTLSDKITSEVVSRFGVSTEQVRSALEGIGMAVRPAPEPEPVAVPEPALTVAEEAQAFLDTESLKAEAEGDDDAPANDSNSELAKAVKKLTKRVKKLEKAAARHGVTV